MEVTVGLALVGSTIQKVLDLFKYISAKDANAVVTQIVVWLLGIGAAFLFAASDFAANIVVNGVKLGALNGASKVLAGIAIGSTASFVRDVTKSIDNNQSAATPSLLKNT